jgi:outer membrane immunogenic protein
MNKNRLLLTSVVAIIGATGSAWAAGPQYAWTGCYIGANAGRGWGETSHDNANVTAETKGWLAGGQIGCDHLFAPNAVVGIEAMAAWADIHGASDPFFSGKNVFSTRIDAIASATARFGFVANHWLIYVKGGAAWADQDFRIVGTFAGTPFDDRGSKTMSGWTWGFGIEWLFAPNWSAKLEYNRYDFGQRTVRMEDVLSPAAFNARFRSAVEAVTVGINYRFVTGAP